jgi:hypothetical protein
MKWVLIRRSHIHMDNVDLFSWWEGKLLVWFSGDPKSVEFDDPERELYLKMCRSQGVLPYEEE